MYPNINRVILEGTLASTPVLNRTNEKNIPVANVLIAVKGRADYIDFIEVVCYDRLAVRVCQYEKGDLISVEAKLRYFKEVGKLKVHVDQLNIRRQ